jgi:site-specific DNA-methyltransferase (adenine-specific)
MVELFNIDAFSAMRSLIGRKVKVDAVICDMPYGKTAADWDKKINLKVMWGLLKHLVSPDTPIILFGDQPFTSELITSNLKKFRYTLVWEKTLAKGFLNANKMPLRAHEDICVFYEKLPTFNPQKTTGHRRKVSKKLCGGNSELYNNHTADTSYDSIERYPRSVIKFSQDTQKSTINSTQKPLELMKYLVNTYTNKDDLVLDFCMGSGTTGVACVQTGRRFKGVDIRECQYNAARERIDKAQNYKEEVINV